MFVMLELAFTLFISSGPKIATKTVAFSTEFSSFATRISGEVANLRLKLFSPLLFRNKRVSSCHFCQNKETNKIILFLAVNFLPI